MFWKYHGANQRNEHQTWRTVARKTDICYRTVWYVDDVDKLRQKYLIGNQLAMKDFVAVLYPCQFPSPIIKFRQDGLDWSFGRIPVLSQDK